MKGDISVIVLYSPGVLLGMKQYIDMAGKILSGVAWLFFGVSIVFANAILVPRDYLVSQYAMVVAIVLGVAWLTMNQVWGETE